MRTWQIRRRASRRIRNSVLVLVARRPEQCYSSEALQLNARRAFQKGFLFSANYMWSHSINDGGIGGGESDTPQDSFCRACDKASSDNDVRQVFNLLGSVRIAFREREIVPEQSGGAAEHIRKLGSQRHRNFTNRSAGEHHHLIARMLLLPGLFAISGEMRPNYVSGMSLVPAGGSTPDGWIEIEPLSPRLLRKPLGTWGRNAFRAPGITQLDIGLSKYVSITERFSLRLRADLFNVANRAQYGAPNADLSQTNFGVITTTISNYATGRGHASGVAAVRQDRVLSC